MAAPRDFGEGAVAQRFEGTTEGAQGGWYVGDPSNQIQNYDPATNTYTVEQSTPDSTQARRRYDLRGKEAGPLEYAWSGNPTFDGVSAPTEIKWGAESPGPGWSQTKAGHQPFLTGSELLNFAIQIFGPQVAGDLFGSASGVAGETIPGAGGAASGGGSAAAGASMPAAVPEIDPTFGGSLTQTAPGVFSTPTPSGLPPSPSMPPAVPESDPTFGGTLQETAPGVFTAPEGVPAVTPGAEGGTIFPGETGESGMFPSLPVSAGGAPGGAALSSQSFAAPSAVGGGISSAEGFPLGSGGGDSGLVYPDSGETIRSGTSGVQAQGGAGSAVERALQSLGLMSKTGGFGPNALPAALTVGSQLAANSRGKSLQGDLKAQSAPASSASQELIQRGMSGDVPPAIRTQFEKTFKDKQAEITQRYANMGRDASTDSGAQYEMQRAADARDAMIADYASKLTSQGLQAAQVASGPQMAAAQAGAQQDAALQQAMMQSLRTMAMLEALKRGQGAAVAA